MTEINALGAALAVPPVSAARPVATGEAGSLPQAASAAPASAATGGGGSSLSIDPSLGITVLKFFSSAGDMTQSFPSQRQLQSYELYGFGKGGDAGS